MSTGPTASDKQDKTNVVSVSVYVTGRQTLYGKSAPYDWFCYRGFAIAGGVALRCFVLVVCCGGGVVAWGIYRGI